VQWQRHAPLRRVGCWGLSVRRARRSRAIREVAWVVFCRWAPSASDSVPSRDQKKEPVILRRAPHSVTRPRQFPRLARNQVALNLNQQLERRPPHPDHDAGTASTSSVLPTRRGNGRGKGPRCASESKTSPGAPTFHGPHEALCLSVVDPVAEGEARGSIRTGRQNRDAQHR
jgi:hypothetical protein